MPPHHFTYAQYLALEEVSNVKHEFLDGEVYAMAGGTPTHALLAVRVSSALDQQLRSGSCRVYSSDLRVRVLATGLATYPDVTVVCGELITDPENDDTVANPIVVVEVLSSSTERFDRGKKRRHYQQIPSLGAVVLISQYEHLIEVWSRSADGDWIARASVDGETAVIPVIDCTLAVYDIYR